MATDPIDKISVEIETTANGAEKGVGDLVRVLESLNNVLDRIAGTGAAKSIREVGRAASKAGSETSVAKKQRVLSKAKETITGKADNESRDEEYRRVNEARRARTKEVFRKRDAGEYPSVPYSRKANAAAGEALENVKKFLADTTGTKKFDYEKYLAEAEERIDTGGLKEKISEATSIIDNYKAKIRELKEEFSGLDDTGIKKLVEGDFLKSANDIENLISSVRKLETLASNRETTLRLIDSGELHATQEEVDSLASSLTSVKDRVIQAGAAADESMNRVSSSVENARQRVDEFKESLFANRTIWDVIKSSAANALDNVKTKLAEAAAQSEKWASRLKLGIPIIGTLASILGSVLRGAWTLLGKLWSGFKRLASTIAGAVIGGLQKLGSMLKTVGGSVLNYVTKPFQRAISVIQKWKKTLARMVFLRVVRSAIKAVTDGFKEGIENLYYFSSLVGTQFAPAMDRLATSSLYLKNSLGAMVGPLIQSLAPVVDFLVDKFVQLLNAINMVFAALGGGGTYTKAIKNAAKYGDKLNDAMGGAAESAKEFKRYLIGIDELNVIPEQTTPGGASGSGAGLDKDYASMFEQAPLPDWVKSIKDAINAGDWKGAGKLLADKVNTSLIEPLKQNAGKWGNTIGQTIQNGIELAVSFVRNLDIEGVGSSVATIIGNALNNIKPADLGAILASGIKSAFRFAHGFLQGYTGPEIGTYLSGVVNGWFAEMRRDNGWKKAAEDLSQVIKGIIDGVSNFLKGLDTASISNDLKTFFGNIDWPGIWLSLKNLAQTAAEMIPWHNILNGLWRFAANVLVFLRENILGIPSEQASQPWIDLETKLSDANETINWADVISGLIAFIGDIHSKIKDAIPEGGWETIWESVKQNVSDALGFDDWEDMKIQFKDKVLGVLVKAFNIAADALYEAMREKHPVIASAVFPEKTTLDNVAGTFSKELSKNGTQIALEYINSLVQTGILAQDEALGIISDVTGVFSNSYTDVYDAAEWGVTTPIVDAINKATGAGENLASGILEGAEEELKAEEKSWKDWAIWPWNWFKEENEIASPSKKFALLGGYLSEGLLEGINEKWSSVTGFFTEKMPLLVSSVSSWWDDVKASAANKWDEIASTVSGKIGDLKTAISTNSVGVGNPIIEGLQSALDNINIFDWGSVGTNIGNGIVNGMYNIGDTLKNWGSALLNGVKEMFEIRSPSRLFRDDVGYFIGAGINAGLDDSRPEILSTISGLSADMQDRFAAASASMSAQAELAGYSANMHVRYENDSNTYAEYGAEAMADVMKSNNEDLISVMYAVAQQVVRAINEKDMSVNFNGRAVASDVTDMQSRTTRRLGRSPAFV